MITVQWSKAPGVTAVIEPPKKQAPGTHLVDIDFEHYATPTDLAEAIVRQAIVLLGPWNTVVEPSAGGGGFVRACRKLLPACHLQAVEVRGEEVGQLFLAGADDVHLGDWLEYAYGKEWPKHVSLVIGNPPFSLAQKHAQAVLDCYPKGTVLVFLLRLSFQAARCRVKFWGQKWLRFEQALVPRPSFVNNGKTDYSEYGLYVWGVGYEGPAVKLPPLVWRLED